MNSTSLDTARRILAIACEKAIERGNFYSPQTGRISINADVVLEQAQTEGITIEMFKAGLDKLINRDHLLQGPLAIGGIGPFSIPFRGFDRYAQDTWNCAELGQSIFSKAKLDANSTGIAAELGLSRLVIEHFLLRLQSRGRLAVVNNEMGVSMRITKVWG